MAYTNERSGLRSRAERGITPLTEADLPPRDTKRWVTRRKAIVVAGVRSGLISLEDACLRYTLSVEEFVSWQRLIEKHGVPGLRATRIQHYRDH
jgi:hypothetical protein